MNDFLHITARLRIRPFIKDDIHGLVDLFSSEETMRYIGPRRVMSLSESESWLLGQIQAQKDGTTRCAVSIKGNNELIGVCGFQMIEGEWDFGITSDNLFGVTDTPLKHVNVSLNMHMTCSRGSVLSFSLQKTM